MRVEYRGLIFNDADTFETSDIPMEYLPDILATHGVLSYYDVRSFVLDGKTIGSDADFDGLVNAIVENSGLVKKID